MQLKYFKPLLHNGINFQIMWYYIVIKNLKNVKYFYSQFILLTVIVFESLFYIYFAQINK